MKAGNVADFLRRWGDDHCYMILLDADSLLTGQAMVKLVSLIERNPRVAIAQLQSSVVLSETLFGRIEQWKQSVTTAVWDKARTVLAATVEGNYFGHNAIVRIAPFIEHGALPVLPIKGPLGGRILSHDTVEWVFLERAGWMIWSVTVDNGSYEESPQTVEEHGRRGCRWQLGDLQHMWIALDKGFTISERAHFASRCAYNLLEFFWWPACLVGVYTFADRVTSLTGDFASSWDGAYPAIQLLIAASLGSVALLPFLKFFNFPIAVHSGQISQCRGGRLGMVVSVFGAGVFSFLQLQLVGVYNFLLLISLGRGVGIKWENRRSGYRNDESRWLRAVRQYRLHTGLGISVVAFTMLTKPTCIGWILLFSIGPLAAVPLAMLLESRRLGAFARKWGLFLTPEEQTPPAIFRELSQALGDGHAASESNPNPVHCPRWLTLVKDPEALRVHLGTLGRRRSHKVETARYLRELGRRLLEKGPGNLTLEETWRLLRDHESLEWLHAKLVRQ